MAFRKRTFILVRFVESKRSNSSTNGSSSVLTGFKMFSLFGKGRMSEPTIAVFKIRPEVTSRAPCKPYSSRRF